MIDLLLILAGGAFTVAAAAATGFLIAPRTALPLSVRFVIGGAALSVVIFLLLAAGAGYRPLFIAGGAALIVFGIRTRAPRLEPLPAMPVFPRVALGVAAVIYLIYTLAPEIQPDSAGYHLGFVAEYVRRHGLPRRVGFYELLPQSVEMLFVPAFMIGRHSAAKLVHFAFLLSTIPLFRHIAHELEVSDSAASTAAALFFLAPVVAVTGTAAYTDLALVCACATVLYLLLRWNREPNATLLSSAGLAAGFCYAVKPSFGHVALAGMIYTLVRGRSVKSAMLFSGSAAIVVAPWLVRSFVLTGNPFAPLFNEWFPNDGIPATLDRTLLRAFSALSPSFSWRMAWPDYTVLGGHQGVLGLACVFLPLALFALRSRAGRRLIPAALLLLLPVIPDAGTRFLMPAMVPATMAFCTLLPAPAAVVLIAVQAAGALRPVVRLYSVHENWMLPEFPLRAALRIESERSYLERTDPLYGIDETITANTEPEARIFAFGPFEQAYVPREILVDWNSAAAAQIADNLLTAFESLTSPATRLTWRLQPGRYDGFRMTARNEAKLLDARPAPPPARVWPASILAAGETWGSDIQPNSTRVDLLFGDFNPSPVKLEGRTAAKTWEQITEGVSGSPLLVDLRRRATSDLLSKGYRYILVSTGSGAYNEIGKDMARNPEQWGVSPAAREKDVALFRISPGAQSAPLRRVEPGASGESEWDSDADPEREPAIEYNNTPRCDPAMIDDTSPRISWHGLFWGVVQHFGNACNGTLTYTGTAGYAATLKFTGTSVTWVYAAASNGGRARVSIDGRVRRIVDQYWPCNKPAPGCVAIRWDSRAEFAGLPDGPHTITIEALHEKSRDSQDYGVNVDGFIVRQAGDCVSCRCAISRNRGASGTVPAIWACP